MHCSTVRFAVYTAHWTVRGRVYCGVHGGEPAAGAATREARRCPLSAAGPGGRAVAGRRRRPRAAARRAGRAGGRLRGGAGRGRGRGDVTRGDDWWPSRPEHGGLGASLVPFNPFRRRWPARGGRAGVPEGRQQAGEGGARGRPDPGPSGRGRRDRGREAAAAPRRRRGAPRPRGPGQHGRAARPPRLPHGAPRPARPLWLRRRAPGRAGRRQAVRRADAAARRRHRGLRVPPGPRRRGQGGTRGSPRPAVCAPPRRRRARPQELRPAPGRGARGARAPGRCRGRVRADEPQGADLRHHGLGVAGGRSARSGHHGRGLRHRHPPRARDGAAAGLQRLDHPDGPRHRRRDPRPGPSAPVLHAGADPTAVAPRRRLHLPGLLHAAALDRRPSPHPLGGLRPDRSGQRRPPVRTTPHRRAQPPPRRPGGRGPPRHAGRVGPGPRQLRPAARAAGGPRSQRDPAPHPACRGRGAGHAPPLR